MSPQPTRALAVPLLGVLASLQLIDPSVANTALVKAGQALTMQGPTLALAASISTLAQAATVLLMGFLGDRLERRQVLMAALLLAIAGDGIAMAAPSPSLFLLGRALAGIAMGGVLVLSFAAVGAVSRSGQLGKALGVWQLVTIVGFIAGSLLGGLLTNASWRLGLALVPMLALLCLPLLPLLLPPMPANPSLRPDWPGLISIAAAMVLFLSGVSQVVKGFSSPHFLIPTLFGVVLFGVHLLIERHRQVPIFPVALYRRGCFAAALVSGIAANFAWAVVQLQTSNFWQLVQHFNTSQVALAASISTLDGCWHRVARVRAAVVCPHPRRQPLQLPGDADGPGGQWSGLHARSPGGAVRSGSPVGLARPRYSLSHHHRPVWLCPGFCRQRRDGEWLRCRQSA